jgi:hypothetical protein
MARLPATILRLCPSQFRAVPRAWLVRSGAVSSISIPIASGSIATKTKTIHSAMYSIVLGSVSEIAFSANGMKTPGFANRASTPTTATHVFGVELLSVDPVHSTS